MVRRILIATLAFTNGEVKLSKRDRELCFAEVLASTAVQLRRFWCGSTIQM
jgi:hypothetical protein